MTDRQQMELQQMAEEISNKRHKLQDAKFHMSRFQVKFDDFMEVFHEKKANYLIQGLLCLAALLFDFLVSEKSLGYLAQIIRMPVGLIALLFSILDAGLAILASGGLAGSNFVKKKKHVRMWRPILFVLAAIKIALFIMLIWTSYNIVDANGKLIQSLTTMDYVRIILPQVLFIAAIYVVLAKAGFGLYYLVGNSYFAIKKFLITDVNKLESEIKNNCTEFKSLCDFYKLNTEELLKEYKIIEPKVTE